MPEPIAALAQGVLHTMLLQSIKVGALVTLMSVGVVGTLVLAQQDGAGTKPAAGQEAKATPDPKPDEKVAGVPPQLPDLDEKNRQILQKLDETIDLKVENSPTLSDFLKAIKKATTDQTFPGIPIYVDPLGLQEAHVSLNQQIDFRKRDKLGFVIREALRPWHLVYRVKDGFLMITSRDEINQQRLEDLEQKVDRLLESMERIEGQVGVIRTRTRKR